MLVYKGIIVALVGNIINVEDKSWELVVGEISHMYSLANFVVSFNFGHVVEVMWDTNTFENYIEHDKMEGIQSCDIPYFFYFQGLFFVA